MKLKLVALHLLLLTLLLNTGCKSLISKYDAYSYTTTSSLKVDVLTLMDKSSQTDYSGLEPAVNQCLINVQKMKEYDSHKPKNEFQAKMWQILWDRLQSNEAEGNHPKGFFPLWKSQSKTGEAFKNAAKGQIGEMFDVLLELESKKIKPSDVSGKFNL